MSSLEPTFMIIGAGKCGTTALAEALGRHPEIFISDPKEPNFFCDDDYYAKGWSSYLELFAGSDRFKARGEASGRYSVVDTFPATAERIARHLPRCKLVYLVREPLSRIESLWIENAAQELSWVLPFNQSIKEQPDIYIQSTNYLRQIDAYRRWFADDQICICFFEDLFVPDSPELPRLYRFLDVDEHRGDREITAVVNQSRGKQLESSIMLRLRTLPFYAHMKGVAPRSVRRAARRSLPATALSGRPEWDKDIRLAVRKQLRPDLEEFLTRYGKPRDFWWLGE